MVIWQITGNEIGPECSGAYYFTTKREAEQMLREYREGKNSKIDGMGTGPHKIEVKNREQLVRALNDAMGYGAS